MFASSLYLLKKKEKGHKHYARSPTSLRYIQKIKHLTKQRKDEKSIDTIRILCGYIKQIVLFWGGKERKKTRDESSRVFPAKNQPSAHLCLTSLSDGQQWVFPSSTDGCRKDTRWSTPIVAMDIFLNMVWGSLGWLLRRVLLMGRGLIIDKNKATVFFLVKQFAGNLFPIRLFYFFFVFGSLQVFF